jgi:hypothetical protein
MRAQGGADGVEAHVPAREQDLDANIFGYLESSPLEYALGAVPTPRRA